MDNKLQVSASPNSALSSVDLSWATVVEWFMGVATCFPLPLLTLFFLLSPPLSVVTQQVFPENSSLPLKLSFSPVSMGQLRLWLSFHHSLSYLRQLGGCGLCLISGCGHPSACRVHGEGIWWRKGNIVGHQPASPSTHCLHLFLSRENFIHFWCVFSDLLWTAPVWLSGLQEWHQLLEGSKVNGWPLYKN